MVEMEPNNQPPCISRLYTLGRETNYKKEVSRCLWLGLCGPLHSGLSTFLFFITGGRAKHMDDANNDLECCATLQQSLLFI